MGNYVSRRTSAAASGKVVLSDGSVQTLDGTTSVAELMLEYPQQFVVEFRSLLAAGARPTPLPADHRLDPESVYLMVPMKYGKAAGLSAGEARRVLSRTRSILRSDSFPTCPSSRSAPYTRLTRRREEGVVEAIGQDGMEERSGKINTPEFSSEASGEMPGFLRRQLSGQYTGWKPSLHTIQEKALQTKVRHWLF